MRNYKKHVLKPLPAYSWTLRTSKQNRTKSIFSCFNFLFDVDWRQEKKSDHQLINILLVLGLVIDWSDNDCWPVNMGTIVMVLHTLHYDPMAASKLKHTVCRISLPSPQSQKSESGLTDDWQFLYVFLNVFHHLNDSPENHPRGQMRGYKDTRPVLSLWSRGHGRECLQEEDKLNHVENSLLFW